MKKDLFKRLINDFRERDLADVKERQMEIPVSLNQVVSLIGVRRSGKTNILYGLARRLAKETDPQGVVYINLEDDRLFPLQLTDMDVFIEAYYELHPDKRKSKVYFLFDEIQNVPHWEQFIRRIHDTENCRIFLTGSSSRLLSRELATSLRGRTIHFEVFPLSFREYLSFRNIPENIHSSAGLAGIRNALAEYNRRGGFPELVNLPDSLITRTLQDYSEMIMYRDVVERNRLGNTFLLKFLLKYCFVNLSTSLSLNKLFNDFRSQGLQLSKNTLYDYVSFLEDAYAIFTVPVYATSLKETFRNPKKLYGIDHGFKRSFDMPPSTDIGRIYENIVFLELKRAGKDIYYVKGKQEVDFYCPGEVPSLINVCYDIENPATRSREVKGLNEAMQTFEIDESILITADREETIQIQQGRIHVIPLWKWLLAGGRAQF